MDVVPWLIALGLMLVGVPVLGALIMVGLALGLRLAFEGHETQRTSTSEAP
ncbi:MAG: hypothetical protein WBW04_20825 [Nitrolancea sp.]